MLGSGLTDTTDAVPVPGKQLKEGKRCHSRRTTSYNSLIVWLIRQRELRYGGPCYNML